MLPEPPFQRGQIVGFFKMMDDNQFSHCHGGILPLSLPNELS
jgi:hypothetical protein